jgi:polyisoprenyl-phosphate glycosyltransferase
VSWTGFRQVGVAYRRAPRFAGSSKYPLGKMVRFAIDGIASFSVKPLTLATWAGFAASAFALLGIGYALAMRLFTDNYVPGWTALMIAVLFIGGVQLIALGIMGEYVGRIYGEAKRRPLYLLRDRLGFEQGPNGTPARPVVVWTGRGDRRHRDRREPPSDRRGRLRRRRSGEMLTLQQA